MKKLLAYFFCLNADEKQYVTFYYSPEGFWQILCKLEDQWLKTKEIDRKNVQKEHFYSGKNEFAPVFSY